MFQNKRYTDDIFDISPEYGFLPKYTPNNELPEIFDCLVEVSNSTPIYIDYKSGKKGLLSKRGALKKVIEKLPNFVDEIDTTNKKHIQTLYRIYSFLASSYLLEPSYHTYLETGEYGKAETHLPENLAQPLVKTANALKIFPWLDYHYSYCLCNTFIKDKTKPATWDNMDLVTKFSGTPDEQGFISIHVDINQNSPNLIKSVFTMLEGLKKENMTELYNGLKLNLDTMTLNNERRRNIYKASNPNNYNELRMFIMGIKGNEEIFGDGVVYEGVQEFEGKPVKFRGQTGAQDDIIPTEDIITGLINFYPENELTKYLFELREYRPKIVQEFMMDLRESFKDFFDKLKTLCTKSKEHDSLVILLLILEQIYKFRNGHWMMVQQYILKQTKYSKATGGTPITTWLPNQIQACLDYTEVVLQNIDKNVVKQETLKTEYLRVLQDVIKYRGILNKQKEELCKEGFNPDKVYEANESEKEY